MAREQARPRAVILAAGRSSRLGGTNKLLVEAGGRPVHEWHRKVLADYEVNVVVRPDDAQAVRDAMPWVHLVVTHDRFDGPGGALHSYLERIDEPDGLLVLFADTLLIVMYWFANFSVRAADGREVCCRPVESQSETHRAPVSP